MTNGSDGISSLARKDREFALPVQQILSNCGNSHLLDHADRAIVQLNNAETVRPESRHGAEKARSSQNEHGDGNLRGQKKSRQTGIYFIDP